jgi:hypothetical protein
VQDAVVAANVLTEPLRNGRVRVEDLAEVQRQREWPTRADPHDRERAADAGNTADSVDRALPIQGPNFTRRSGAGAGFWGAAGAVAGCRLNLLGN